MLSYAQGSLPAQGAALQNPGPALQNVNAAAYEAANKVLGQSGEHIEALGSDAPQSWMQENGVEERDGGYWQRQKLPSDQLALVQMQPPKEVLEADRMGRTEISTMMYRSLEGEIQALMKKVAFNPEAFTIFSWAKRKGFLAPDKDFAARAPPCFLQTTAISFESPQE